MNEPGWVTATVNLRALKKLRSAGEMRNFEDWALQPGASGPSTVQVEIVISIDVRRRAHSFSGLLSAFSLERVIYLLF